MSRAIALIAIVAVFLISPFLASCSSDGAHARTYYTCPMHPNVIGVEGAKCSTCGMLLVAKEVKPPSSDSGYGSGGGGHDHSGHSH